MLYLFGCVGRYLFCIGEVYVLRLLYGTHAHGELGGVDTGPEGCCTVHEHLAGHGAPLAAVLEIPPFVDGHAERYGRRLEHVLAALGSGVGHTFYVDNTGAVELTGDGLVLVIATATIRA